MTGMTRRQFAAGGLMLALGLEICGTGEPAAAQARGGAAEEAGLPERSPDDWMRQWQAERVNRPKLLQGPLDLRRFKDPVYVLLGPIGWRPTRPAPHLAPFTVPRGFVTDFASVPRVFWRLFRPDGDYAYAAVLHDYLYWEQTVERSVADEIFRAAMDDLKIKDWQAEILYRAVDLFGSSAWEGNSRMKASGEQRVLFRLPSDSTQTWSEWKSKPDVFPSGG